ncbi:dynein axonemal heavy chain 17-like isoform 3-T3 [Anableps anableps]
MEGTDDKRFELVRILVQRSFRLDPAKWLEFLSENTKMVPVNKFMSGPDILHLFFYLEPDSGIQASLSPPSGVRSKVLCVSRILGKENSGEILKMQEFSGEEALRSLVGLTQEVTCPLLSRAEDSSRWAVGVAQEALKLMERQKSSAQVIEAQVGGLTFLPPPEALCQQEDLDSFHQGSSLDHGGVKHDDEDGSNELLQEHSPHNLHLPNDNNADASSRDSAVDDRSHLRDNGCQKDQNEQKTSVSHVSHLLHACEETVVEWVELVSDFLQQDWSGLVLDQLKPVPSEEFSFWKNRLKNLLFIQNQLMSPEAHQVASILQADDSVYWTALQDLQSHVLEGVREAEDIVMNLTPVQQKLSEVMEMDFHQLRNNMAAVMEEVHLLWTRSDFYCQPRRMVVLLQEICNLFIHLSRKFLPGQEVIGVLVSEPGPVLEDVRLVIQTLQALKSAYSQQEAQLELQDQDQVTPTESWTFLSHLVFFHLDIFLRRLLNIQEVHCVTLQFYQLDQMVLTGVSSTLLTDGVQQVYQAFLVQVRQLSSCSCDPTDPEDQTFEQYLDQFQAQVSDLETRLVSVLSKALEDCRDVPSAAKLVKMFWFFLDRPLVQDQLPPYLNRLVEQVLMDLHHTELEFYSEREKPERFFRFRPAAAARLCWNRLLRRRTEETLRSFRTIQNLCGGVAFSQLVLKRSEQIVDLLQDFRSSVRSDWSSELESQCGVILNHSLIQISPPAHLEVAGRHQLEAILQELSLHQMVSCYNQVVGGDIEAELPLIQKQLQELKENLSELEKKTWICEGVQQESQQVLIVHSNIREARANMDTMRRIAQGWVELDLLQRSGDSLLEGGIKDQTCRGIKADGEQLLRLTQVNRSLYSADESSETWTRYLDYVDDQVQDGLLQLLLRALHFLTDSMNPQTCGPALLAVSLQLQETAGLVFEPTIDDGPVEFLKATMRDVYGAAALVPRISASRDGNYQVCLQQNPELCALEQEVMTRLLQVKEEAELLRAGLDRYSHLWLSDRKAVFQEFLTYGRQLGAGEVDAERNPATLKEFQREIQVLLTISSEVTQLEEVVLLQGWLQVDLRPFTTCLLSIILDWKHMYTHFLLESTTNSLQQVTRPAADQEESSSSTLSLIDTILLLEAAGVELPEHLAAQLQVVTSL